MNRVVPGRRQPPTMGARGDARGTVPVLRGDGNSYFFAATSADVMSYVIMNPLVPLYSNAFGPIR